MIIVYILLALLVAGLVAMLAGWVYNRQMQRKVERGELEEMPGVVTVDNECCGQHEVCEKDSLLAAVSKDVEYYDDEELDRFRGRSGADYDATEADEFRDIFYSMRDDEVAGWVRSLQLRGVALPDELKDEIFLIVGERRMA
ncbi:MAG: hypothetical protein NC388_06025 [Clostridium sp.]|nr:hypothetical protein [Clostridium sp.]